MKSQPSLQDFSLIRTSLKRIKGDEKLSSQQEAFYYFVMDIILKLQSDEIDDSITDTAYLQGRGRASGHDRGVDAIYIDDNETPRVIHLFNFKYTDSFQHVDRYLPGTEVDKLITFINDLMGQNKDLTDKTNNVLATKVDEIWSIFKHENPKFVIHVCTNYYYAFEKTAQDRLERDIRRHRDMKIKYHTMTDLVVRYTSRDREVVDAKIRATGKNYFEKSSGDVRALILDMNALDLIRIVMDDESIRMNPDSRDYDELKRMQIIKDAFEDNVRIYLKQRSTINRNIKKTALDEGCRIFYYNNGITITCDEFSYQQRHNPIIDLHNIQIVNGGQSVHALFEAFQENQEAIEDIDILCRIYETKNKDLSRNIAEYTNSQNPVKSRDVRSNDYVQKKLEKELQQMGYYYERKKNQHSGKFRDKRIDAEKVGQVLLALFGRMPAEAKDKKRLIFAEKYDEIFTDALNADMVLLALKLFEKVDGKRKAFKKKYMKNPDRYDEESYLLHASYYLLFTLGELCEVEKKNANEKLIFKNYSKANEIIKKCVERERKELKGYKESYNHRLFFKSNRPKKHIEKIIKKII